MAVVFAFIDQDKWAGAGYHWRQAGDGALPERVPRPSQCEDGPWHWNSCVQVRSGFCVSITIYAFITFSGATCFLFPFSFQKTSGGGRDSTGLPFSSRPKLNLKCHQPRKNLLSTPFFPAPTWMPSPIFRPAKHSSPNQTANQSSFSRQMCPCATQEVHQKSPFFYTRSDTTHHEDGKL